MGVRVVRRFLAMTAVVVLSLALLPAAATAAPPVQTHEDAVVLSCDADTGDGFVSLFAVVSTEFGTFADLVFWADPAAPMTGPPTHVSTSSEVSGDASGMTASFDLVVYDETQQPPFGAPAGEAVLEVTFTPVGDPIEVDDRYRVGNRQERVEGTVQMLSVEGSLTLPGNDIEDLSGQCQAAAQDLVYFSTAPASFVDRFQQFNVSCSWEGEDGFVQLYVVRDAFSTYGEVVVGTGESVIGGGGDIVLTDTSLTVTATLEDFETGMLAGTAEAVATLTPTGERTRQTHQFFRETFKVRAEVYAVDGSLDVTIDGTTTTYPMDDEHCYAADERVFLHSVRPAGPKGKPLANDTPEGASPLRIGRTVRTITGGNALEPEAPCVTMYLGAPEPVPVPLGYTAWWTVTGTGGPLTVDTAGSTFDTVVGVYVMGDSGLEQIVCVDDVMGDDGLLAVATWDSEAGVTYYIQAGGFGESAGRLVLTVR